MAKKKKERLYQKMKHRRINSHFFISDGRAKITSTDRMDPIGRGFLQFVKLKENGTGFLASTFESKTLKAALEKSGPGIIGIPIGRSQKGVIFQIALVT